MKKNSKHDITSYGKRRKQEYIQIDYRNRVYVYYGNVCYNCTWVVTLTVVIIGTTGVTKTVLTERVRQQ